MRVTLELHEFGVNLRTQRFRRENPEASESDVAFMVAGWLASRPFDAPNTEAA